MGSVHGRHDLADDGQAPRVAIAREAEHLFSGPSRGPRADKYIALTRAEYGPEAPQRNITRVARADMTVTGSIPSNEPKPSAPLLAQPSPRPETYGVPARIPLAERSSASLFLSTLSRASIEGNEEDKAQSDAELVTDLPNQKKSGKRLAFAGETETEYQGRQRRCLATAIYFEARGEPEQGQLAVAQVVMNRVRSSLYPDTICGVVYQGQHRRTGCQFSFTCDGVADVPKDKERWRLANEMAYEFTKGETFLGDIGHATHYHANYVNPRWRRELSKIKKVGAHIFYRVKGDQIEDVLKEENPARGLALAKSG